MKLKFIYFLRILFCVLVLSTVSLADSQGHYKVIRVIDGDTIVLSEIGKVRLIGINTPETVDRRKSVEYFGNEASSFLKTLLQSKSVRVEYDFNRKDKYGRTLAYIYLPDGTFVNAKIVKEGYGFAYTRYPFKHLNEFRQYEKEARLNKRGLWEESKYRRKLELPKSFEFINNSSCAPKTCKLMQSCEEAKFQLEKCGNLKLDRDKDGVPCEHLCKRH